MSQYTRKDPPWSHVGVPGAGLNQTLMQQNQSLLGAQPGVVGTPTTNVYGQSMVSNTGLGAAGATTAYPTPQQTMQQRQNIALQQQQAAAQNAAAAAAAAGSQGGGTPQLTVSYPTTRATQGGQPRQRVFTGTVTKLHDTFGFVDEDVFFQTNTVKGTMPKIGERVLVEATYNASMPFKWNATRIQLLNSPLEQQVAQPAPQQQQHHAAMKMQQLKMQQQQQPSRIENVSQQFKMLKQSQQPLLKAPQASNMMPTHSQPPPPGLLGNPPPLLQQPPPGVVQQPALLQGNTQAMQNLAGAYAHQGRTTQIGQQSMARRDFSSSGSRERERDRDRERERDRAQRERDRERDREHRERERERERERRERDRARDREKSPVKRSRSPRRSKSPRRSPRRTKRLVQRYCVQIPRFALDIPKSDVIELHKRYMNMYIPSDFFLANFAWQDVFPIHRPMNVAQPCTFHIMHKEAPPPQGAATVIDPPDANYSYCAKVMLMTSVSQEELYEKCCARAQDSSEVRENFQHPTRLINFLVGQKGKNEVMAIGGPWSPSLDGADPVNDTSVLIKTAIRTTKALTGIDLTTCTQWYRFLELSYHRPEEIHKGRVIPARVETVVIFVPDVWHILPTKVEWESLAELYKKTLSSKLAAVDNRDKKTEDSTAPTQEEPAAKDDDEDAEAEEQEQHQTPTNWKDLDPKNMKVNELRQELEIRGLNSKGLKSQLIARLTKMLKSEQEMEDAEPAAMETDAAQEDAKEEQKEAPKEEESSEKDKEKDKKDKEEKEKKEKEDEKKKELIEEEKRRQREREKRDLETRYTMPEVPSILVHPSPIAKSGKFDCSQQSLSVLLDYRVEDNKEHSFEVFLFAELFNEMLQRDFAFNMYKAIYRAPEKKEEKKDEKKKENKDKKEEKEKKDEKKDERKDEKDEKKEDKKEDEPKAKRRKTEEKDAEKEESKDKDEGQKDEDSRDDDKDGEDDDNDGKSNDDDADDDDKRKDKKGKDDKSKIRVKMETHDPHLLLSCIYFDQNHCGYILERDLEEILYTVGLHLSRAQVRKLLQKVVTRDCWSYRKLTDGPKKEKDEPTKPAEANNVPTDSDLAKGNQMILDSMASSKKGSKGIAPDGVTMVKYGGTVIDIANLLKQVQKADQERSMAEKKIESLEKQIETLKSKASSSEATVTNVSGELLDVQKKLSSSERALLGSSTRSKKLIDVIGSAQKNLDEIMLKFNEVLEEAMLPPTAVKVAEKVTEKVVEKVKEEPKVKTETKPTVKVEAKSPKGEK